MTQEEALRMALEALEADELDMVDDGSGNMVFRKEQAITAIKEHLKEKALQALHDENERLGLYKDAYAEQKPMAWISTGPARMFHWTSDKPAYGDDWVPLYTTSPQRKPLTDEDVERIVREATVGEHGIGYTIARAIEAAHGIKEKNNG